MKKEERIKAYIKIGLLTCIIILLDQAIKLIVPRTEQIIIPRILKAYICGKHRRSL
ncbi:MAG: hypothetical protein IKP28_01990 [Clostridia bacterium]|nr:hypothetical protein [Clostridia bacterium]